jgi:hypothetical protein
MADKLIESYSFDPAHFDSGIPTAVYTDTKREVLELNCEGKVGLLKMGADARVAVLHAGNFPGKALDREVACGAAQVIDISEIPGAGLGYPKGVGRGLALA